jgi:hypothetical protein
MVVGSLPPPFRAFPPYLAPLAATGGAFLYASRSATTSCLDPFGSPPAAFCAVTAQPKTLADSPRPNCESWRAILGRPLILSAVLRHPLLVGHRLVADGVVHIRVLRLGPIDPEACELRLRDERLNSRRMLLVQELGALVFCRVVAPVNAEKTTTR